MRAIPAEGERFGRYDIRHQLGRGAMGVVLSALQRDLNREVALKVMSADLADQPEFRARFLREAATLARLDSRHVIAVYDAGDEDGRLYIATQLIPDGDLATWLRVNGPLPPAAALAIAAQVSEGLADAHRAGIVHRDIKPSNVLLRKKYDGSLHAYLCDLGIARVAESDHTHSGGAIGTYTYMAPERHRGADATEASDIYAVGCLLWAMLTGHAPYRGADAQVMLGHLQGPIPQLDESGAIDVRINEILRRSLAKLPSTRFRTADRLRIACESALRETTGFLPRSGPATSTHSRKPGPGGALEEGPTRGSSPRTGPRRDGAGPPSNPPSNPPSGSGGSAIPRAAYASQHALFAPGDQSGAGAGPSAPATGSGSPSGSGMGVGAGGHIAGGPGHPSGPGMSGAAPPPPLNPRQSPHPLGPPPGSRSGKSKMVALALVGVLLLAGGGSVAAWALTRGGDGGGGGGDQPDRSRVTRAADAPRDADKAEFCRAMAEGESDTDEQKKQWAEDAVQVGTPSDMSEDERNGYEVLFRESLEGTTQSPSGGDLGDMFLLIAYIGKTCPNVTAPTAPAPSS